MKLLRLLIVGLAAGPAAGAADATETDVRHESTVVLSAAKGAPFPHFWDRMFGSGRALLSLRESYRYDVATVRAATGFEYLRFHDILDDDVGVVVADAKGAISYNFSLVDEIYDGLLDRGVRPFVELSFMPRALAANTDPHVFWYKPLPSPPKDFGKWAALVGALTQHLVDRYGLAEVNQWYFEVWNEPNLDFWTGNPKQKTYFELYDAAARAIKAVAPTLRVGGPATAQAAWIPDFIRHCSEGRVPVDFVSTHVYGNDPKEVIGSAQPVPMADMVAIAVRKVFREVGASAMPRLPIIWSEFNASWFNDPSITDSAFIGPWLANTIRQADGFVSMMSYWDFSDVFDEAGVTRKPFYGGFGLIAEGHIPKAAFNDFVLLRRLGTERLPAAAPWILATRRPDGSLALAIWNYADPDAAGPSCEYEVQLSGWTGASSALVEVVDANHGSALGAWNRMGAPAYPTRDQDEQLRKAAQVPAAVRLPVKNQGIRLTLPIRSLALVEISAKPGP